MRISTVLIFIAIAVSTDDASSITVLTGGSLFYILIPTLAVGGEIAAVPLFNDPRCSTFVMLRGDVLV